MEAKLEGVQKSLLQFIEELQSIFDEAHKTPDATLGYSRLDRWKERLESYLASNLSIEEEEKLRNLSYPMFMTNNPFKNFDSAIRKYTSHIDVLIREVKDNPDYWLSNASVKEQTVNKGKAEAHEIIIQICEKFHAIVMQLRQRYSNRTTIEVHDEYDVQDLFNALLKINFDDIRPEENTPSHAGSSGRMDFLLKEERIVIETKMTREKLSDKELGKELLLDINFYKGHQDCKTLICFIYDPGSRINNRKGLIKDLESHSDDKMKVIVLVNP